MASLKFFTRRGTTSMFRNTSEQSGAIDRAPQKGKTAARSRCPSRSTAKFSREIPSKPTGVWRVGGRGGKSGPPPASIDRPSFTRGASEPTFRNGSERNGAGVEHERRAGSYLRLPGNNGNKKSVLSQPLALRQTGCQFLVCQITQTADHTQLHLKPRL